MYEPFVSIIIPVRNEAQLLRNCLKSISVLNYPKERIEIIVADGLSTDGTADIAKENGARVLLNQKQTVSPGRNIAFLSSRGELVAFTDADCVVDDKWLRNAIKYFRDEGVACVGGPNITPPEEGSFSKAVGFVFGQRIFAAGSIHARTLKEVQEVGSIPGCNAIYKRGALDAVMPIDESLLTCDDTELNQRLLDKGYKLLYTPDVFVWHHRRPNPKRLWSQMYRYAIGRLQVGKRDRRMINWVHILIGLAIPLGLILVLLPPPLFSYVLLTYCCLLLFFSAKALYVTKSLKASLLVPFVISIVLFAWSSGFMRELIMPYKSVEGK